MKRYWRVRNTLALLVVAVTVALRYEIEGVKSLADASSFSGITAIIICTVLGLFFSELVFAFLVGLPLMQWILLGNTYIGGVWIADTFLDDEVVASGLVQVRYDSSELNPIMTAYFPKGIRADHETRSISANLHVRDGDLHYLNHFSSMTPPNTLVGVATGHFFKDSGCWLTGRFDGTIFYNDDKPPVRQTLRRVEWRTVRKFRKKFGVLWMANLVQEKGQYESKNQKENIT